MRCLAAVFALILSVTSALAIDFTLVLADLDGKPLLNAGVEVTLGATVVTALLTPYPDEQNLAGEEKVKRFLLATKVRDAKDPKLTADEIALIKKLVGKAYPPLVVGRVWELIDPASVAGK